MAGNAAVENALGTVGTVLWCIQLIPQVWLNWRTKKTEGLSPWLMFLWVVSGIFFGAYNIAAEVNIPLIVQPQCYATLCAVSWCQTLYYDHGYSRNQAIAVFTSYMFIGGGLEVAFVYAQRAGLDHGTNAPLLLFGIIACLLLIVGFFPQLYEIYRLKRVQGISYLFLLMDGAGAIFSVVSLAFAKGELDRLAVACYVGVLFFEILILVLALVLNPIARRRRLAEGTEDGERDTETVVETETSFDAHAKGQEGEEGQLSGSGQGSVDAEETDRRTRRRGPSV